jgi:type I restriction-modification system DNA methylase subunit
MNKAECLQFFGVDDIMNLPKAVERVIQLPTDERDRIYREFMRMNNYEMGRDWFQRVYEEEFSQRKNQGQDFTPIEVTELCAMIAGVETARNVHEPTAGTGQMIISAWWTWARSRTPWEAFPSQFPITVWEILDRTIPFLLFNLSIRGIMGYVYNGDTLEKTVKRKYILLNRHDDALGFSEIIPDDTGTMTIRGLPETTWRLDIPATVYVCENPKADEPKQVGPKQLTLF